MKTLMTATFALSLMAGAANAQPGDDHHQQGPGGGHPPPHSAAPPAAPQPQPHGLGGRPQPGPVAPSGPQYSHGNGPAFGAQAHPPGPSAPQGYPGRPQGANPGPQGGQAAQGAQGYQGGARATKVPEAPQAIRDGRKARAGRPLAPRPATIHAVPEAAMNGMQVRDSAVPPTPIRGASVSAYGPSASICPDRSSSARTSSTTTGTTACPRRPTALSGSEWAPTPCWCGRWTATSWTLRITCSGDRPAQPA